MTITTIPNDNQISVLVGNLEMLLAVYTTSLVIQMLPQSTTWQCVPKNIR